MGQTYKVDTELRHLEKIAHEFEDVLRVLRSLEANTTDGEKRMEIHAFTVLATRYYNSCYSTSQLLRAMELLERSSPESREMISADIRKLKEHGSTGGNALPVSKPAEVKELLTNAQKVLGEAKKFVEPHGE
ncbi:MAG TPA: hypothetical protein VGL56_15230 [Fimbriimonadaceae bacterium]|jgi:hypothetical protein